jgi:hypothetical protein
MVSDSYSLLRRLPVHLKLVWLLLLASVVLLWCGLGLHSGTLAAWGLGCALGGTAAAVIDFFASRKPGEPAASEFRTGLAIHLVILVGIGALLLPLFAIAGLLVGLRQGFSGDLALGLLRLYALFLYSGFVLNLPATIARTHRRANRCPAP